MKRVTLVLFLAFLGCAMLFAAGSAESKSGEKVEVRALIRPDEGGNIQKYSEIFSQQSGIQVNVDFASWAEIYNKTISTLAAGGGGYDIIFIPSANVIEFTSAGEFEPIDDAIPSAQRGEWLKAVLDLYTVKGKLIAMPWYSGGAHMVYNKEMLQKAGVDPAKIVSWDDFLAASQAVKKAGLVKYAYTPSIKYPGNLYYAWGSMVASSGEPFFDQSGKSLLKEGKAALSSLQLIKKGIDLGVFDPAGIAMDDYETLIQFGSGETAFMMNSTWSATQANVNPDLSKVAGKVGYMLIPGWNSDVRSGGFLYAGGLGVLKSSKGKAEAKQFLTVLTGPEAQKHHAIEGANLPTRVALFTDKEIDAKWSGYSMLTGQLSYGSFLPQFSWLEEWRQAISGTLQTLAAGKLSPEAALDEIVNKAGK